MKPAKLVSMLNGIALFYAAMPDGAQASHDVAAHLKRLWEPRLRIALYAWLDAGQPPDGDRTPSLHPLAARVLIEHRALLVG